MNLISAILALYYCFTFICFAVPQTFSVGGVLVVLISGLLRGMTWLLALVIKLLFVESQDDPGQADQVLSSMGERIRQFHQDVNNARIRSTGKTITYTGFGYEALVATF